MKLTKSKKTAQLRLNNKIIESINTSDVVPFSLKKEKIAEIKWISGVYFLFNGDNLEYIGSSVNILLRIKSTTSYLKEIRGIETDTFSYLEVSPEYMRDIEEKFIRHFMPRGNFHLNPSKRINYIPTLVTQSIRPSDFSLSKRK